MKNLIERYPTKSQRFFEIIIPLLAWGLITMPLWLSFWHPALVAYFIITFDVYWFYKSFMLSVFAIRSFVMLSAHVKVDWLTQAKNLTGYYQLHHIIIVPEFQE